jgi:hypothetical protein
MVPLYAVIHDGREHIDYVRPQIVTEYIRHVNRSDEGKQLEGIVFPRSRFPKGKNLVVFATQEDLKPTSE